MTHLINVPELTPPPTAYGILTHPPTLVGTSQMAMTMDGYQLASVTSKQSAAAETLPAPTASARHLCHGLKGSLLDFFPLVTTTPTIIEPTLPPPATRRLTTSDYPPSLKGPKGASQVAMDEHQLTSAASNQSATVTTPPTTTASMHLICRIFKRVLTKRLSFSYYDSHHQCCGTDRPATSLSCSVLNVP
jgi:hypothetical protein